MTDWIFAYFSDMGISWEQILSVLSVICEEEELLVTVRESGKGALKAEVATFLGGLIAGSAGILAGETF